MFFIQSRSPIRKKDTSNYFPAVENSSPDLLTSNKLHSEIDNKSYTESNDSLASIYKKKLEQEVNETIEQAEKNPLPDIFQSDDNNPRLSRSFLDHLYNQESPTKSNFEDNAPTDDVFTVGDNGIQTAADDKFTIDKLFNGVKKLTDDFPLVDMVNAFFDDLNEETEVVIGLMDEEALFNRRSRKANSSSQLNTNGEIDDNDVVY